jgi:FAD/FMN-containing dehydrogenase
MTIVHTIARPESAAARNLRAAMQGEVALPSDKAYSGARQIWNGAVEHRPALFAFCETPEDVQAAVRAARAHGLPLSVRGGGHDWAGRSLRHNGLVVDLSRMRRVDVDRETQTATVEGGASANDVIAAATPHGLVAVTGNCGTVGMTGLTLGGGYGAFAPRFGLALDNLLGADVVLADGRRITVDALEHPELFWALRGGGGNFGVVTSMQVQLHPIREVLAGMILFPWSDALPVLLGYAEAMASAPDELTVMAGVLSGPDGGPVLFLAPTWSGEPARGEQVIAELQGLGTPMVVQIGPMTYGDLLGMYDAYAVKGRHYALQTRWLPALTPDVIVALIAAGGARTSLYSAIVLHYFHGAATRIAVDSTAFGLRQEHFLAEIIAAWNPDAEDDGTDHRQWAWILSQVLARSALPGGYPNLLGPDERDQIALAYGGNLARLQDVKQRFDPDGIFTSAIPLPARRSAVAHCRSGSPA